MGMAFKTKKNFHLFCFQPASTAIILRANPIREIIAFTPTPKFDPEVHVSKQKHEEYGYKSEFWE